MARLSCFKVKLLIRLIEQRKRKRRKRKKYFAQQIKHNKTQPIINQ